MILNKNSTIQDCSRNLITQGSKQISKTKITKYLLMCVGLYYTCILFVCFILFIMYYLIFYKIYFQIYVYNVNIVFFFCRKKWVYIPNYFLKSFDPFWKSQQVSDKINYHYMSWEFLLWRNISSYWNYIVRFSASTGKYTFYHYLTHQKEY